VRRNIELDAARRAAASRTPLRLPFSLLHGWLDTLCSALQSPNRKRAGSLHVWWQPQAQPAGPQWLAVRLCQAYAGIVKSCEGLSGQWKGSDRLLQLAALVVVVSLAWARLTGWACVERVRVGGRVGLLRSGVSVALEALPMFLLEIAASHCYARRDSRPARFQASP
jgi:hypothetical protein